MFDLFRSRAKVVRYLLGAVLVLVAVSMVVTLIPGFVGASFEGDSNVVAEIGDEVLTTYDVQRNIQQQLRNNQIPRELIGNYVPTIINNMITQRALAYQAERMGFEVTDEDVALAVQSMIPTLFQNGQYVGDEVYAQYLAQMNLTIPQFESNVRKQMLLLKLVNMALEGEIVTDEEVEREFRRQNELVQIEYVKVAPQDFRDQVSVSRAEVQEYFNANRESFRIGEKRDAKVLVVDQNEVGASIEVPEEELRRIYRSESDRFRTPERVKVRHILLKTTDMPDEEIVEVKAKAEDLLAQLKAGADFAELAEEHSEDPGSASEGGEIGWITRGQTVENFEKTAFSLEPGTLSDVITTEYGFHIIEVVEKEQARLQPFEEVREQIIDEARRQQVVYKVQELADQARARLIQNPLQPEQVANELGLTMLTLDGIGPGDQIPELAPNPQFQDALLGQEKAGVTQVFDLGADRLAVGLVTEVHEARLAELSEVEDQIRERLINQKTQALAQEKRQKLEELVSQEGNDLEQIARGAGLEIMTSNEFGRNDNVEGVGSAAYFGEAFEAQEGDLIGPLNVMSSTVVCKVIKKTPPDMTKLAEQREEIENSIRQDRLQARQELLEDGILTRLIDDGKVKINERTIQRLVSAYAG